MFLRRSRISVGFCILLRIPDMKNFWKLLPLFLLMSSPAVFSQEFKRFEFHVMGGLTVSGGIPLDTEEDIDYDSIHVNNSHNVGAAFAVNLNDLDTLEWIWQRQFTEGRLPAGITDPGSSANPAVFDLNIDQYHMNFLHHYHISVPKMMPYVMAGLGATTYYASGNGIIDSRSYFSFAVGGGIKYFVTNHFGLRGEARWSPTVVSASDSSFWCQFGGAGAACAVKLSVALQDQLDLTGGLFFRF